MATADICPLWTGYEAAGLQSGYKCAAHQHSAAALPSTNYTATSCCNDSLTALTAFPQFSQFALQCGENHNICLLYFQLHLHSNSTVHPQFLRCQNFQLIRLHYYNFDSHPPTRCHPSQLCCWYRWSWLWSQSCCNIIMRICFVCIWFSCLQPTIVLQLTNRTRGHGRFWTVFS